MNSEIYRRIPFFSLYEINIHGTVRRIASKKIAKPRKNGSTFCVNILSDRGDRTTRTPKNLVLDIFHDIIKGELE